MYWSLNPLVRAIFLSHEQDELQGKAAMATGSAYRLHTLCAETFGDSRLVENAHQHGKDLLRNSKHENFGLSTIFANTLRSGALEERDVATVAAANAEKVSTDNSFLKVGVAKKLSCRGFKLAEDVQQMLQKKTGPSHMAKPYTSWLVQSVAATEACFFWLLQCMLAVDL